MTTKEQPPERRVLIQGPGQSRDAKQEITLRGEQAGRERREGKGWDAHLGHARHERGAAIATVIETVTCNPPAACAMPSSALGTFHYH